MLIDKKFANKKIRSKNEYDTGNGLMSTDHETKVAFTLPEFSDKKIITWQFNVGDKDNLGYDMIIGRDLLSALGMNISFQKASLEWDGI